MNTAVEFTRWAFLLGLLCGVLAAGTGCPQLSGDPLDKIRGLQAQNRYEESLEGLRALMDEDPTDPEVNYLFGKTLVHVGELSLAIWPLRRAVEFSEYAFDAGMLLAQISRLPTTQTHWLISRGPSNSTPTIPQFWYRAFSCCSNLNESMKPKPLLMLVSTRWSPPKIRGVRKSRRSCVSPTPRLPSKTETPRAPRSYTRTVCGRIRPIRSSCFMSSIFMRPSVSRNAPRLCCDELLRRRVGRISDPCSCDAQGNGAARSGPVHHHLARCEKRSGRQPRPGHLHFVTRGLGFSGELRIARRRSSTGRVAGFSLAYRNLSDYPLARLIARNIRRFALLV